jgi:energy-coupling factor transporter transmembrane protein EcfT
VFDQFLMRWKVPASVVYFFILFACLNLVLPALLPDTRTLITLLAAAAIAAIVFFTMHVPAKNLLRPAWVIGLMAFVAVAVASAYFGRRGIPPVPMHIASGAVGPSLLPDGRLTMHVSKLHESLIQEMHALTDVLIPGGHGNNLHHVWRRDGLAVQQGPGIPGGDPPGHRPPAQHPALIQPPDRHHRPVEHRRPHRGRPAGRPRRVRGHPLT